jgi:hypothetical protein
MDAEDIKAHHGFSDPLTHHAKKKPNQRVHHVLIVGTDSVFFQGLSALLAREADLRVSSVVYQNTDMLRHEIAHLQPDAILINQGDLPALPICELLEDHPPPAGLRLLAVRPDDHQIHVYQRQSVMAHHVNDLLALIRRTQANNA